MSATRSANRPAAEAVAQRFEQRRTSARRRRILRVGALLAAVALLGAGLWVVLASPVLAVRSVTVVGNTRTATSLIELTADIPRGVPLARVDLSGAQQRLSELPSVASATLVRSWPSTVRIVIVERQPVAVALSAAGVRLIDKDGHDIGGTRSNPPGLTVIAMNIDTTDPATFVAAANVVAGLPAVLRSVVTSVTAEGPNAVDLHLVGGALVHWGDPSQPAEKARVLHALLSQKAMRYNVSAPDSPTTGGST